MVSKELADMRDAVVVLVFEVRVSVGVRADLVIGALTGVVINVLAVIIVGVGIDMLAKAEINVKGATVIVLEFGVPISYTEDVMVGVLINPLAGFSFDIIIIFVPTDVSADLRNEKLWAAVVTGLDFAMTAPSEDSLCS